MCSYTVLTKRTQRGSTWYTSIARDFWKQPDYRFLVLRCRTNLIHMQGVLVWFSVVAFRLRILPSPETFEPTVSMEQTSHFIWVALGICSIQMFRLDLYTKLANISHTFRQNPLLFFYPRLQDSCTVCCFVSESPACSYSLWSAASRISAKRHYLESMVPDKCQCIYGVCWQMCHPCWIISNLGMSYMFELSSFSLLTSVVWRTTCTYYKFEAENMNSTKNS